MLADFDKINSLQSPEEERQEKQTDRIVSAIEELNETIRNQPEGVQQVTIEPKDGESPVPDEQPKKGGFLHTVGSGLKKAGGFIMSKAQAVVSAVEVKLNERDEHKHLMNFSKRKPHAIRFSQMNYEMVMSANT